MAEKESYTDRYGRRFSAEVEVGPDKVLTFQQAGIFARRVDISLNGIKLKSMNFVLPFGSFKTEIEGKIVEVKQKTGYVSGSKLAKFTVKVDGEIASEFQLSKSNHGP